MPQFWIMMNGKEKLRLVLFVFFLVVAYFYIDSQNIGPVVSAMPVDGIVHAIQASSPLSGVASAFFISVTPSDGRIVSVEVPTSANIGVGDNIKLEMRKHQSGRNSFALAR